jgi:hypothetical protein
MYSLVHSSAPMISICSRVTAHSIPINVKVEKQRSSFIKTGKNYTRDSVHENNMRTARDSGHGHVAGRMRIKIQRSIDRSANC